MPAKQNKYKLQDVAADLGIERAELITLLDETFGGTPRKAQSSLSADEVNYVLNKYTKMHEVTDVVKAFGATRDIKSEKPVKAAIGFRKFSDSVKKHKPFLNFI
ncbi:MAG: hypothetical protein ACI4J8_07190 [Oscillospiraceae bacterium]